MQEEFVFEPIAKIQKDLASSPFLRFYLQEETFRSGEGSQELPFNQMALEVITDIQLSSKFLTANTRINTNFLLNGMDIYKRKEIYFKSFLEHYPLIKEGLVYLPPPLKEMFVYTVIAFSNLILKLSINTNKINIVVVTETPTPSFLNVFIVSVLFEKYLGLQVINNKELKPEERRNAVRQLPKLTIIKISKKRNPFDFYLLSRAQDLTGETHNIQFIELFEQEDSIKENLSELEGKRREKFNLKELFGLKAPYGMELYLLFLEILIDKMNSFKPDAILFVDAFPLASLAVQPNVKGLIINELSAKVQNKISIFKVIGVPDNLKTEFFAREYRVPRPELSQAFLGKLSQNLSQAVPNIYLGTLKSAESGMLDSELRESLSSYMRERWQVQSKITNQFLRFREGVIFKKLNGEPFPEEWAPFKTLRKCFHDDVSNLALSLTQQRNFEDPLLLFRNYSFSVPFLNTVVAWVQEEKKRVEQVLNLSDLKERLENKIEKLERMKDMASWKQDPLRMQVLPFRFYNLALESLEEPLEVVDGRERPLSISQDHEYYIHYAPQHLLIFHFGPSAFTIYCKRHPETRYIRLRQQNLRQKKELSAKQSTLIASDKYFYKAFGQFPGQEDAKSYICRLKIDNLTELKSAVWELLDSCTLTDHLGRRKMPLDVKVAVWAYHIPASKSILLGGGLSTKLLNEEKVNKSLYYIRDSALEVVKYGKTSAALDMVEKDRKQFVVHPLIYGVPLGVHNNELVVLATNGYAESLNHWKKLFITKYRVPANSTEHFSVTAQNKVDYKLNTEATIANKNSLLALTMGGYFQVNRFKERACFFNVEGYAVVVSFQAGLFGEDRVGAKMIAPKDADQEDIVLSFPNAKMSQPRPK